MCIVLYILYLQEKKPICWRVYSIPWNFYFIWILEWIFLNSVITKNEAGFWGGAEMGLLYNSRVILGHNFKNYSQMRCKKFK